MVAGKGPTGELSRGDTTDSWPSKEYLVLQLREKRATRIVTTVVTIRQEAPMIANISEVERLDGT